MLADDVTYELKMKDLLKTGNSFHCAAASDGVHALISMILPALLLFGTNAYVYIATLRCLSSAVFSIWSMAINSITTRFWTALSMWHQGRALNRGLSTAYTNMRGKFGHGSERKTPEDARRHRSCRRRRSRQIMNEPRGAYAVWRRCTTG
jgi:hypothetical protein